MICKTQAFALIELPVMSRSAWLTARKRGFTLIELLVVITIIVVLLAMLVPGMDKAIYHAELAVCMSNLDTIAGSAITYASGNARSYPYRPTLNSGATWRRPNNIVDPGTNATQVPADDRQYLKDYFAWKSLADPLSGKIDLGNIQPGNHAFSNYELWFGSRYPGNAGLLRLGDRMAYGGARFNVLASDEDKIVQGVWAPTHSAHPDAAGVQYFYRLQNEGSFVLSRWQVPEARTRGEVDTQHVFLDGSAARFDRVQWDEYLDNDRMARVPISNLAGDSTATYWSYIPAR